MDKGKETTEEKSPSLAWGIAYCLAYDRKLNKDEMERLELLIETEPMPQGSEGEEVPLIAEAARLLVCPSEVQKESFQTKEALRNSRLYQLSNLLSSPHIALIMGGATKIKHYVFESAQLPEIRGASALLDCINLCGIPALFAQEPNWSKKLYGDPDMVNEANQLVKRIREDFRNDFSLVPPDCEDCIIYASGGEVLAFAPIQLADSLTQAIERLYTRETLIANSGAVWRSCSLMELQFGLRPLEFWIEDLTSCTDESLREILLDYYGDVDPAFFLLKKSFGELTALLAIEKLGRREGNKLDQRILKPVPSFETTPYAKRCQSCEHRNAVVEGPRKIWLCEPCARKRVFGQKAKREVLSDRQWFDEGAFEWKPLAAKAWGTMFEEWLEAKSERNEISKGYYQNAPKDKVWPAKDLEEIAAVAQPEGFIGMIYADGNNMGALLEKLETPARYQQFAYTVYDSIIEATFTALAEHLHPFKKDGKWLHPFEILSIGGDDVFLIVPAHVALPMAITISKHAEQRLAQNPDMQEDKSYAWRRVHRIVQSSEFEAGNKQTKVSLSSGVVIANHHTPIFFLRRLVEELLKSAKAKAKSLRKEHFFGATIDFMALKSIGMVATNIHDFRKSALQQENLHFTAKPYTVSELYALIETGKEFKRANFPKSQLYKLREQLEKGWLASTMDYLYFQSRSPHADKLRNALDDRWIGAEQNGRAGKVGLWLHQDHDCWETILGDLVEIYDFIPE